MTRARLRAYDVHRVLDEFLEVFEIRYVEEKSSTFNAPRPSSDFRSWRTESLSRDRRSWDVDEEETPSKYYCIWKIFSSRVLPTLYCSFLRDTSARRGSQIHVQYQTRKQLNFLSPTNSPVIHLYLETNYNLVCREGGIWFLWHRKDIQWSISLFLLLSLSHARACMLDETMSYFSLIFMLIGEFPYLPVITWLLLL